MKYISLVLLSVVLLAACSQQSGPVNDVELNAQAGSWQPLGGALDTLVARDAVFPRLLLDRSGSLVAAWQEKNNGPKIYLKRWNGSSWQPLAKVFALSPDYEYLGYGLVFDTTNSPVIAKVVNLLDSINTEVEVYRFDNSSQSWQQLGTTFKGSPSLATNKNGVIYSVLYDKLRFNFYESGPVDEGLGKGKNIIRRWDGNAWQNVRTYKAVIITSTRGYDVPVNKLSFKSNGTSLVIDVNTDEYTLALKSWDVSVWQNLCTTYRGAPARTVLDKNDQCFGYDGTLDLYQGTQLLDKFGINPSSSAFSRSNRPTVPGDNGTDVIVKRWTGSAWAQLGGVVDRVTARNAYFASLLVDGNNTLYVAWSECVTVSNCSNRNIYVSKYVP